MCQNGSITQCQIFQFKSMWVLIAASNEASFSYLLHTHKLVVHDQFYPLSHVILQTFDPSIWSPNPFFHHMGCNHFDLVYDILFIYLLTPSEGTVGLKVRLLSLGDERTGTLHELQNLNL